MAASPPAHHQYTVGCVCALDAELRLCRGLLDDEFAAAGPYICGRAGEHLVVLSCVAAERLCGASPSEDLIADLHQDYPSVDAVIRVGLPELNPPQSSPEQVQVNYVDPPHSRPLPPELEELVELLRSRTQSKIQADLLDWLSPIDTVTIHQDIKSQQHPQTCRWFFEHAYFSDWLDRDNTTTRHLLGTGPAGAGKTTVAATVVSYLNYRYRFDDRVAVCFFYHDHVLAEEQTTVRLLASLLEQLCRQMNQPTLGFLHDFRHDYSEAKKVPGLLSLLHKLELACAEFDRVFLIIDGLDDVLTDNIWAHQKAANTVASVAKCNQGVQMFATLRHGSQSAISLTGSLDSVKHVQIKASVEDLKTYLESRAQSVACLQGNITMQHQTYDTVISAADGNFLLAAINWTSIENTATKVDQVKAQLLDISARGTTLSSACEAALQRIETLPSEARVLAISALQWALTCETSMQADELRIALAMRKNRRFLAENDLPTVDAILGHCQGLICHHEASDTVTVTHRSIRDILIKSIKPVWLETARQDMGLACIRYLGLPQFKIKEWESYNGRPPMSRLTDRLYPKHSAGQETCQLYVEAFDETEQAWLWDLLIGTPGRRKRVLPLMLRFYAHALTRWTVYLRGAFEKPHVIPLCLRFFLRPRAYELASVILCSDKANLETQIEPFARGIVSIPHVIAHSRMETLAYWAKHIRDGVLLGHQHGLHNRPTRGGRLRGKTLLRKALAARSKPLIDLFLSMPEERKEEDLAAVVREAVEAKDSEMVAHLIKKGADPNGRKHWPLLFDAVGNGDAATVKALLAGGADIEEGQNETALILAVKNSNSDMVQVLLDHGANVQGLGVSNTRFPWRLDERVAYEHGFAFQFACRRHDWSIAQTLLDRGAAVDGASANTVSPLAFAVHSQDLEAVHFLLNRGANPLQEEVINLAEQTNNEAISKALSFHGKPSESKKAVVDDITYWTEDEDAEMTGVSDDEDEKEGLEGGDYGEHDEDMADEEPVSGFG